MSANGITRKIEGNQGFVSFLLEREMKSHNNNSMITLKYLKMILKNDMLDCLSEVFNFLLMMWRELIYRS